MSFNAEWLQNLKSYRNMETADSKSILSLKAFQILMKYKGPWGIQAACCFASR